MAMSGQIGAGKGGRRLRQKNLALLLVLIAFVVLVYLVSIVRMGGG